MHGMAKLGVRDRGTLANYLLHVVSGCHLPLHLDRARRHAATAVERIGRDLCPQNETIWRRVAAGDAERKGIAQE
jgi:hypothetical protein